MQLPLTAAQKALALAPAPAPALALWQVGRRWCWCWCERGPEMAWIDPSQYAVTVKTNEASQRCIFYRSWCGACHSWYNYADTVNFPAISVCVQNICVCASVCGYVSVLNYAMCRARRRPYTSFTMRRFHLFFAFALIFSSLHFHGQPTPDPPFPHVSPFAPQLCCNPRLLKHSYRTAQHWTATRWSASDGLATSPAHNAC